MVTATPTPTIPTAAVVENRTGRPSDFTTDKRTAILEAIKLGLPEGRAAELCGLDPSTLAHWKARGRREESGPYADFLIDLSEADAHCERALLSIVRKAAEEPKHWSAAMSLMERKWPKRWSRADRYHGLTAEEVVQNTLRNQRASDLLDELQNGKARIEKALEFNEKRRSVFVEGYFDAANKRLEEEKEMIEERIEWFRFAINT